MIDSPIPPLTSNPYTTNTKLASCIFTLGSKLRQDIPITKIREKNKLTLQIQDRDVYWFEKEGTWKDLRTDLTIPYSTWEAMKEWCEAGSTKLDDRIKDEILTHRYRSDNESRLREISNQAKPIYLVADGPKPRLITK